MNLDELVTRVGPGPLHVHVVADGSSEISDVVIYDAASPLARGQLVLAVGVDAPSSEMREVLRRAEHHGAAAVVVRGGAERLPADLGNLNVSVLLADRHVGWAQLHIMLRTLIYAIHDETPSALEPLMYGSAHDLADAIAVMVSGSVVLYDRAHRVIAYSAQGHEIDSVRRDAILGKRTPEQWIRRFTIDRSAYQTYQNPGEVVRLDNYPGLRTRLRIAVHTQGEVLGEISVAEADRPLGQDAETALKQAATLAAPFLLRRRQAEDTDRTTRWRLVRGLLDGDPAAGRRAATFGLDPAEGLTVVGFLVQPHEPSDVLSGEIFSERLAHLLSLQIRNIAPSAEILFAAPAYYAVVPTPTETAQQRLRELIRPVLAQLERLKIEARAAIGPLARSLGELPVSRRMVDDVLLVLGRIGDSTAAATGEDVWAELALLSAERRMRSDGTAIGPPLQQLLGHDRRHRTEFVKTLQVYLEEFGSISAAAERLILHPNTLRHRLQRLTEISGLELSVPTQRLAISLQLNALPHHQPDADGEPPAAS
jgi:hypothetical protein